MITTTNNFRVDVTNTKTLRLTDYFLFTSQVCIKYIDEADDSFSNNKVDRFQRSAVTTREINASSCTTNLVTEDEACRFEASTCVRNSSQHKTKRFSVS